MISFRAFACAALALSASITAASSHITLTQRSAPADSYFRAAFTVPHGCDGAATTRLSIWLPEAILQAKPMVKPGWIIEVVKVKLAASLEGPHGTTITERVVKIVFSGGTIPNDHIDEFILQLRLPKDAGTIYFPVEQECGTARRAWNEVPSPSQKLHELDSPAAALTVTPKP